MEQAPDKPSFVEHVNGLIGRIIGKVYWVLIGWWVDAPMARKRERVLARDIREGMPFLFKDRGAEIVPNEGTQFPPPLDYALVTVAVGHLLLRFVRGLGELHIQVAARGKVRNWQDWKNLELVQTVLDESNDSYHALRLRTVGDADHLLRTELPRLLDATSDDQWDLVKRKANALFPAPMRMR